MRTSNPALNSKTFRDLPRVHENAMTIGGTVNKTVLCLTLLLVAASFPWRKFAATGDPATIMPMIWIGFLGGLGVALVTVFKKEWSAVTAPLYSLLQGLALGAISSFFEAQYPGIVIQAVGLTLAVTLGMLMLYRSGLIQVTEKFRMGVFAATGGIMLFYMFSIVGGFFGLQIGFLHDSSPLGIGFSLLVVGVAALNLVLDFDFIDRGAAAGAPKFMEWYGAFGLMVTLVWLYLEMLRLMSKIRGR